MARVTVCAVWGVTQPAGRPRTRAVLCPGHMALPWSSRVLGRAADGYLPQPHTHHCHLIALFAARPASKQ